ncbi:hypothetical protein R3P38DRAFT_3285596 [Favolaschia claudopus]|uniref:Uncharacterized protein n=1 Tax=Favolaschia claudopus TaxID=2862362 RepID=A0AAW0A386_9AGAR
MYIDGGSERVGRFAVASRAYLTILYPPSPSLPLDDSLTTIFRPVCDNHNLSTLGGRCARISRSFSSHRYRFAFVIVEFEDDFSSSSSGGYDETTPPPPESHLSANCTGFSIGGTHIVVSAFHLLTRVVFSRSSVLPTPPAAIHTLSRLLAVCAGSWIHHATSFSLAAQRYYRQLPPLPLLSLYIDTSLICLSLSNPLTGAFHAYHSVLEFSRPVLIQPVDIHSSLRGTPRCPYPAPTLVCINVVLPLTSGRSMSSPSFSSASHALGLHLVVSPSSPYGDGVSDSYCDGDGGKRRVPLLSSAPPPMKMRC